MLLVQETKLACEEDARSAVEFAYGKGWLAQFSLAETLESGKPSGGVGILVRAGANYGISAHRCRRWGWSID